MKLKATTNVRQYIRTVSANNKRRIQKATVIANQRAAKMAATQIKTFIADTYSIKKSVMTKKLKVYNGNYANPQAKLKGEDKGLSLEYFNIRPRKVPNQKGIRVDKRKNVSAEVKRGERKIIQGAFLLFVGGTVKVFKRLDKAGKKIKKLLGPGIALLLGMDKSYQVIKQTVQKNYDKLYKDAFNNAK